MDVHTVQTELIHHGQLTQAQITISIHGVIQLTILPAHALVGAIDTEVVLRQVALVPLRIQLQAPTCFQAGPLAAPMCLHIIPKPLMRTRVQALIILSVILLMALLVLVLTGGTDIHAIQIIILAVQDIWTQAHLLPK